MNASKVIWDFSSQSKSTMSIEYLVDNMTRRHVYLMENPHQQPADMSQDEFYGWRIHDNLESILGVYHPGYVFSERIEAFWLACKRVGLLDENGKSVLACSKAPDMVMPRHRAIVELIYILPGIVLGADCQRRMSDRRYEAEQRSSGLSQYLRDLVSLRSTTLIVRIDGGYRHDLYPYVTVSLFYDAVERLRGMIRKGEGAFRDCLGHAIVVEQGVGREFHFHALLVFDASKVASDWHRGQLAGKAWVECTNGYGTFFNCHALQAEYERRGVNGLGTVVRGDAEKLKQVLLAARYLSDPAKEDQYLRIRPAGARTFWRGRAPEHSGLGRPPRLPIPRQACHI